MQSPEQGRDRLCFLELGGKGDVGSWEWWAGRVNLNGTQELAQAVQAEAGCRPPPPSIFPASAHPVST